MSTAWIDSASDALNGLLNPQFAAVAAEIAELREANVPYATRQSLYPIDPTGHMDAVRRLLYHDEFVLLVHSPLWTLDAHNWLSLAPKELYQSVGGELWVNYETRGATYSIRNLQQQLVEIFVPQKLQRKAASEDPNQQSPRNAVAENLLLLPLMLRAFERYPFTHHSWEREAREDFDKAAHEAEQKVKQVLALLHIYGPEVL